MSTHPSVSKAPIGIMGAIRPELAGILVEMTDRRETLIAGRKFRHGRWHGRDVVVVLSRVGKVSAALTATILIERFGVHCMVFTGVAGGLSPLVRIGDIVVARSLVQCDMDASPIFPRYEVPLYGKTEFATDTVLSNALATIARQKISELSTTLDANALAKFSLFSPQVHEGLVLCGDRFVTNAADNQALQQQFPNGLCIEMESAAAAQVCHDYGVAFSAIRTISDQADDSAHADFSHFVDTIASRYSTAILGTLMEQFQ